MLEPVAQFLDFLHFDVVDVHAVLAGDRVDFQRGNAFGERGFVGRFGRNRDVNRLQKLHPGDASLDAAGQVLPDFVDRFKGRRGGVGFRNQVFRLLRDRLRFGVSGVDRRVFDDAELHRRIEILPSHPGHQEGRGGQRPRFFLINKARLHDVARHQVNAERRFAQELQREPVRDAERRRVVFKLRIRQDFRALQFTIRGRNDDVEAQALREELAQPREFHRVPKSVHTANFRVFIQALVIFDRTLDFGEHIVKDRLHREHDGFRVLRGRGVALDMFGVREGQFERFRQGFGEHIAADGDVAEPNVDAVRNDDFRRVRPDVQNHVVFEQLVRVAFEERVVVVHIVNERVVQGDLRALNAVDLDSGLGVAFQRAFGDVALHRVHEDAQVERDAALQRSADLAIVPNNVLQVEGKPLFDLVFNEVAHLFGVDRRKRLVTPKRVLSGNGNRDFFALDVVARKESFQAFRENFVRVRARLRHNLAVFDKIELQNFERSRLRSLATTQRFQRRATDVDTPYGFIFCHNYSVPYISPDAPDQADLRRISEDGAFFGFV